MQGLHGEACLKIQVTQSMLQTFPFCLTYTERIHMKLSPAHASLAFAIAACVVPSTAAQAETIDRSTLNSSFEVRYGRVEAVEKTKVSSTAPGGAIMGGIVGGATSGHSHRGKHAAEGALAGAILGAVLDGNRNAYKYIVDYSGGGETEVITESGGIRQGDCVAVETGRTANIRRVTDVHCDHYGHEFQGDPMVHAKGQQDAAQCHAAKEIALQADTEDEMDLALKKVRVFCED